MSLARRATSLVLSLFVAVDLFCGAGGFTEGAHQAFTELDIQSEVTLVNHWTIAMRTQKLNHPDAKLFCTPIEDLIPTEAVPGRVDMLIAAPECTHFSKAAGGVPKNDQSRSKASYVLEWVRAKLPTYLVVENVPEFLTWGPIDDNGKVIKELAGTTFNKWIKALRDLGYMLEWKVVNCADYGVPQTRKRFILIGKRNSRHVPYPAPTRSQENWDIARNHIDLSRPSQSIYTRKKPLAPKTLKRIEVGLEKLSGPAGDPFLVVLRNHMNCQSLDVPFSTVTAGGGHFGLVQPFLTKYHGGEGSKAERVQSIDDPFLTLDTQNRFGLAQPCLVRYNNNGAALSIDVPFGTVTTKDRFGLAQPCLVEVNHGSDKHGYEHRSSQRRVRSLDLPFGTITTKNGVGLAQPMLLPHRKFDIDDADSVDRPFRTLDATNCRCNALAIPKLVQIGEDYFFPDIHFRMLAHDELAAAQSFPKGYKFEGNAADVTKQIGNAIPPELAKQITLSVLYDWIEERQAGRVA